MHILLELVPQQPHLDSALGVSVDGGEMIGFAMTVGKHRHNCLNLSLGSETLLLDPTE